MFCSFILAALLYPLAAMHLTAQYSYLPTASTTDGRFFALTGGSIQTLGDNSLVFKLASASTSSSIEIGVFDGDTYGVFDQGTVPLIYTLYADPEGNATGTTKVGEWRGDAMINNGWYTITLNNSSAARCGSGSYFYMLTVRSSDAATMHWSSFKLRTNGTLVLNRSSTATFAAPLGSALDAAVIYPAYPTLTPTTYDGTWRFTMDVTAALTSLSIWDGDFDRGSYDCTDNDTDDSDTPNAIPGWATGAVRAEGLATSSVPCQNSSGQATGGTTTSNPPDDSRTAVFVRSSGTSYEVITPSGTRYANSNPSGNLEWEQFRLSTSAFDRTTMDYQAASLPAGSYQVAISGMDLGNLNAVRFPFDVTGVNSSGVAVTPLRPDYTDGVISGKLYYESGTNCSQSLLELGIPLTVVHLAADYNYDGIVDEIKATVTDLLGAFSFTGLHPGNYTVMADDVTLILENTPVCDSDGVATPNTISTTLTMCSRSRSYLFGYRLLGDQMLTDASTY